MSKRKVTRRQFIKGMTVAGLGAAGAQLLAACAAPAAPQAQAPQATGAEEAPVATDVVLRVQVPPEGGQSVMPTILGERFQEETGIGVEIEETIYGEIETKTQTGYISGTLQDLLYGHHRWLFINFLKGMYLELNDQFEADPLPEMDDIYPSVLEGNMWEGSHFSVPGVVHPGGNITVTYNKTMLEEKGLPEPQLVWSMQEWEELARAAADPTAGIFGMGMDSMSAFHYYSNTARSFGEPDSKASWVMNEEGTQLLYDQPLHGEITNWWVGLLEDKVAPRKADYIEESAAQVFVAGLSATHASVVGNLVRAKQLVGDRFEIDAVPLPPGPEGRQGTCYSGNQHMISSITEHPEEAYELLKRYSSIEAGMLMVLEGHLQANGHKAVWVDPEINEINRMFGLTDALLTAGIEPFPMPANTRFTEANDIFRNEIDLIWEGDVTWEEHAPVIVRKVNEVLDMPLP